MWFRPKLGEAGTIVGIRNGYMNSHGLSFGEVTIHTQVGIEENHMGPKKVFKYLIDSFTLHSTIYVMFFQVDGSLGKVL